MNSTTTIAALIDGQPHHWNQYAGFYGPSAKARRVTALRIITGEHVKGGDPRVGYGRFCEVLAAALGVTDYTCTADRDKQIGEALATGGAA